MTWQLARSDLHLELQCPAPCVSLSSESRLSINLRRPRRPFPSQLVFSRSKAACIYSSRRLEKTVAEVLPARVAERCALSAPSNADFFFPVIEAYRQGESLKTRINGKFLRKGKKKVWNGMTQAERRSPVRRRSDGD